MKIYSIRNKKNQYIKGILFLLAFFISLSLFLVTFTDEIYADENKATAEINHFYTCNIEGIIDPSTANYLGKCLEKSQEDGSGLIILMDTPGGLETSMREIIKTILNTAAPVIVFVYPDGARAASAGVFIIYASDIAVMSPGSNIGAAHPVNLGGEQQISEEMMEKVVNDSVSFIRSLASLHDRNADWAEKAVRESDSITADKALELGVIDFISSDLKELMEKVDGKIINKQKNTFVLNTSNAVTEEIEMSFISKFLHIISNPNIAYLLFIIGIFGIIYEFSQPGLGISGAIGVLFIILGLYSFSILPINYAGLGLIILAIILFILDIKLNLGGILSILGIISMLIGSFLLIDTGAPYLKIAKTLIICVTIVVSGFIIIVVRAVYKTHIRKPVTGKSGMIGETAITLETLNPDGQIKIDGEIWNAISKNKKKINKGEHVIIISIKGLTLFVQKIKNKNKSN
ncbi:MAG: nodulation protein NfeD [Actinobacteria bacterium]|nr:nodulation protein NfeD [Actinomycetota bacterium]MBL7123523.1 nodulation protein NfeD [Actinomycetota bacterium]